MELIENDNDSVNHEREDNDENSELSDAISVTDDWVLLFTQFKYINQIKLK